MLSIKNLTVYNAQRLEIIKSVTFEIKDGEVLALLGVNGSGKTSVALSICGHLPYKADHVMCKNISLQGLKPHEIIKLGIAFVSEKKSLFRNFTVEDSLKLSLVSLSLFPKKEIIKDRLQYVYELFPRLFERANQNVMTLSGGEQQMLCIASALMINPKLLILDEPTQGLSVQMVDLLFVILNRLKNSGVSILLIEQNIYKALDIANHAVVLKNGKITLCGSADDLKNNKNLSNICLGID